MLTPLIREGEARPGKPNLIEQLLEFQNARTQWREQRGCERALEARPTSSQSTVPLNTK
jgi:hypothetical protein